MAIPLSQIVFIEEQAAGIGKSAKIVVHLHPAPPNKEPGPFQSRRIPISNSPSKNMARLRQFAGADSAPQHRHSLCYPEGAVTLLFSTVSYHPLCVDTAGDGMEHLIFMELHCSKESPQTLCSTVLQIIAVFSRESASLFCDRPCIEAVAAMVIPQTQAHRGIICRGINVLYIWSTWPLTYVGVREGLLAAETRKTRPERGAGTSRWPAGIRGTQVQRMEYIEAQTQGY
ncbi:uncharacterized protein LOC103274879 isoform X1 [Carlito syrichta]|uniref:Uncharacterized protein LOC103274879 isoform X1 n=1 Tax=Carlito syrichta TaxID=1868482 RepID=A0A3Q0DGE9_CARSF|nr:uncharacterized protein LOC103274879 isoform X1 [Carlito syrichta]